MSLALLQVSLTRGRVYTGNSASGYHLELTTKHKSSLHEAAFQMQIMHTHSDDAQQPAAETELSTQQQASDPPDKAFAQRAQHAGFQMPCVARQASPHAPVQASGHTASSQLSSHAFRDNLSHPSAPLQPAQAYGSHLSSSVAAHVAPQVMSQGSQHHTHSQVSGREGSAWQGSAPTKDISNEGGGVAQTDAIPSGMVYFSHCLNEKRHITEATTSFTCFACKQRCKGLLVSLAIILVLIRLLFQALQL